VSWFVNVNGLLLFIFYVNVYVNGLLILLLLLLYLVLLLLSFRI
jgi:hypothetical protein